MRNNKSGWFQQQYLKLFGTNLDVLTKEEIAKMTEELSQKQFMDRYCGKFIEANDAKT